MQPEIKLTREQLYKRVWETPTTKLAAEFCISDVALSKICRRMDVPKPPPGYWRRIETGTNLRPVPLPVSNKKTIEFVYMRTKDGARPVDPDIQALIDREELPENHIKLSSSFENAHTLIKKTNAFFEKANLVENELIIPVRGKGYLDISISPPQVTRALLIMDALIKAVEIRGYKVIVSDDHWGEKTRIVKEGQELSISLYEKLQTVKRDLTPEEKKKPPYLLNIHKKIDQLENST